MMSFKETETDESYLWLNILGEANIIQNKN
jgi:hypothetical protein